MPAGELRARIAGKDALVSLVTDTVDRVVIDAAPALKIVANVAVGYNNVDVAYARSRGIAVTHTPDVLTDAVADLTWAMILGITRRTGEAERLVRRGEWTGWALDFMLGSDLRGRQLGIVGLGRIGRAVAERGEAFGMKIVYASRPGEAGAGGVETGRARGWEPMSFDRLLNTSDVVSLHVPLTPDTRHLVDRKALTRMKRSAYLVNTSRGQVVDEDALVWALEQHLIAGVALDVYEREPQIDRRLLQFENVLLLPHIGSATSGTRTAMAQLAADNVAAVLSGRPPLTPVP
jgi:glyoxylate reductase